ncbi:MAG: hypothetical protein ACK5O7_06600 [Holosporales bacterium]
MTHAAAPMAGLAKICVDQYNELKKTEKDSNKIKEQLRTKLAPTSKDACSKGIAEISVSKDNRSFLNKGWKALTGQSSCHQICLNSIADSCVDRKMMNKSELPKELQ